MPPSPVAIIGLGLMGEVYATRLIAAGIPVTGYDIDPTRRARLADIGGTPAETVSAALAEQPRCILLAVFSTDQVEDVVEQHILPAAGENSNATVVCTTTADPDRIAALAKRVEPRGIRFLDVPVSGTSDQVRCGDGVALIGGDADIAASLAAVFDALFARRFHIGKVGDGGRAKLAVNLILGLNRLALAEGIVFAERLGLDPAAFLEVAKGSASYSQVMETKGGKMVRSDFAPQGRVKQTLKDCHLMLDQARAAGQTLSMLEVHAGVLDACVRAGEADMDNSAIINEVRRRGTKGGAAMGGDEQYERGLKLRIEMFGQETVEKRMAAFGELGKPLQHIINSYSYGDVWSRTALNPGAKSLVMVAMMAASGHMNELRVHLNGAVKNGCTLEQIQEVLLLLTLYCGIPAANEAHRIAAEVLREHKLMA